MSQVKKLVVLFVCFISNDCVLKHPTVLLSAYQILLNCFCGNIERDIQCTSETEFISEVQPTPGRTEAAFYKTPKENLQTVNKQPLRCPVKGFFLISL
jgi:hypothetical protein